jgi:hypothetical protein
LIIYVGRSLDSQDRTASRTTGIGRRGQGHLGQSIRERTDRTEQLAEDNWDGNPTVQSAQNYVGHDNWDRTAPISQSEQIGLAGQPGQYSEER